MHIYVSCVCVLYVMGMCVHLLCHVSLVVTCDIHDSVIYKEIVSKALGWSRAQSVCCSCLKHLLRWIRSPGDTQNALMLVFPAPGIFDVALPAVNRTSRPESLRLRLDWKWSASTAGPFKSSLKSLKHIVSTTGQKKLQKHHSQLNPTADHISARILWQTMLEASPMKRRPLSGAAP